MPIISMFLGIIIRMFNNGEHNPRTSMPHIKDIMQCLIWMAIC